MIPVSRVHWRRSFRIIPTQYPVIRLFEGIVGEAEDADVERIINATSPRVQAQGGTAPKHAQYVHAPMCYFSVEPGRFTTRFFGAYYTASTLKTAIHETVYHTEQFLRRTNEPAGQQFRRVLVASVNGLLHDLRGRRATLRSVYSPTSYAASQKLAAELWRQKSRGIVYDSVRFPAGQCAAVYDPALLSHCHEERTLVYSWDGRRVHEVFEMRHYLNFKKEGHHD